MSTLAQNITRAIDFIDGVKDFLEDRDIEVEDESTVEDLLDLLDTIPSGGEQPQLNKLTVTRSGDTITISNPSSNGGFVEKFRIYNNGTLYEETTGTSFSLVNQNAGSYSLTFTAIGTNFIESEATKAINCSVCTITKNLTNLNANNSTAKISSGQNYTVTLTPISGKYLPEDITVTMGGQTCKYTYDSYTGVVTVPSVSGNIVITATAYDTPKLRRPALSIDGSELTVTPPLYAESTDIYIDDTLVATYPESE